MPKRKRLSKEFLKGSKGKGVKGSFSNNKIVNKHRKKNKIRKARNKRKK